MQIKTYCERCSASVIKSVANNFVHAPLCNACRTNVYLENNKLTKRSRRKRTSLLFLNFRKERQGRLSLRDREVTQSKSVVSKTALCLSASPQELLEKKEKAENQSSQLLRTCKPKIILRKESRT